MRHRDYVACQKCKDEEYKSDILHLRILYKNMKEGKTSLTSLSSFLSTLFYIFFISFTFLTNDILIDHLNQQVE